MVFGCPVKLGSATVLLGTIVLIIYSLYSYICNPVDENSEYKNIYIHGYSMLSILLIVEILELSFASLALWGLVRIKPFLVFPYILWSIILMFLLGYIIYTEPETPMQKFIEMLIKFFFFAFGFQDSKPFGFSLHKALLCIPIVFKGFITMIVYQNFRSIMVATTPKYQNKVDLRDIEILVRKHLNEVEASRMNKTYPDVAVVHDV